MKKQINYKLPGSYILLKTKDKTDSGILLPQNIKQHNMALEIAMIGPNVTSVVVGDMIVFDGSVMAWTIDDDHFYQIHESSIVGIVLNGATINPTPQDNFAPKEPTAHYNG